jgi:hypothetical protein
MLSNHEQLESALSSCGHMWFSRETLADRGYSLRPVVALEAGIFKPRYVFSKRMLNYSIRATLVLTPLSKPCRTTLHNHHNYLQSSDVTPLLFLRLRPYLTSFLPQCSGLSERLLCTQTRPSARHARWRRQ